MQYALIIDKHQFVQYLLSLINCIGTRIFKSLQLSHTEKHARVETIEGYYGSNYRTGPGLKMQPMCNTVIRWAMHRGKVACLRVMTIAIVTTLLLYLRGRYSHRGSTTILAEKARFTAMDADYQ